MIRIKELVSLVAPYFSFIFTAGIDNNTVQMSIFSNFSVKIEWDR